MRYQPRFRNGFWSSFDTLAYRPGYPCRTQAEAVLRASHENADVARKSSKKSRRATT